MSLEIGKLNFSGHETFQCREIWLKKGFDFLTEGLSFRDPSAVVELGVGRNMVNAIQYWLKAFGLMDAEKKNTPLSEYIFGKDGRDPYLEDNATLWLLHYKLIKERHASVYSLLFNEFRKKKPEFTRNHLTNYLVRKCSESKITVSENTLQKDGGVLLSTYLKPNKNQREFKDLLTGLLIDLELIERINKTDTTETNWYRIINTEKEEIPVEVLLFCILDNQDYGESISLHNLLTDTDSVGSIFALSGNGMVKKVRELTEKYPGITYTDDAGIKELQFKKRPNKLTVLDNYYGN